MTLAARDTGPTARDRAVKTATTDGGAASRHYGRSLALRLTLMACVALLAAASFCFDMANGPGGYRVADVLATLIQPGSHGERLDLVVFDIRLPVSVSALLFGAMLGLAGATMQTILDNPLAEPFTLGVSAAASFGASLAIALGIGLIPDFGPLFISGNAFIAALAVSLSLFVLAHWRGARAETLILFGIAMMFTFNALLSIIEFSTSETRLQQIVFWMMGSLQRATLLKLGIAGDVFALALGWTIVRAWGLTALRLGDARAASLGVGVKRLRLEALVVISLLAATTVSIVGNIGFIGLVGPHVARMLVGEDQRMFLPASALIGGLTLSLASVASKSILPGVVFPIGVITALIGVPFFVALIISKRDGLQS